MVEVELSHDLVSLIIISLHLRAKKRHNHLHGRHGCVLENQSLKSPAAKKFDQVAFR